MGDRDVPSPLPRSRAAIGLLTCSLLAACAGPSAKEEEAVKNTFACKVSGERVVIRLEIDEARLLMPEGNRIVLYQIPVASGVRYSNGTYELRGKGMDLQFIREGAAIPVLECEPMKAGK